MAAREPQKSAKSAVLSSKIKVFAVWRAGAENGRKKPKKGPKTPPARPKTCLERKRKAESEKAVGASVGLLGCRVCLVAQR